jgi:hypothetical protein
MDRPTLSSARLHVAAIAFAALLAGCASGAVPTTAIAPAGGSPFAIAVPDANPPPACKGQKNTKTYAKTAAQPISSNGGKLCVAAFGGWGGWLIYPKGASASKITLTSSTTAYDPPIFPPEGSLGAPIFYLQIHPASAVTFGTTIGTGFGIESIHLAPKKAYTVRYSTGDGSLWLSFGACYAVAKKVTNGGSIPNVGTRLEGQKVYPSSDNVIEIFSGKLTTGTC